MAIIWIVAFVAAGYGITYLALLLASQRRAESLGKAVPEGNRLRRAGVLMACMVGGMLAKYVWDATATGSFGSPSLVELLRPLLVSPIVFGAVWAAAKEQPPNVLVYVTAFQNGFFWQTIFGRIGA